MSCAASLPATTNYSAGKIWTKTPGKIRNSCAPSKTAAKKSPSTPTTKKPSIWPRSATKNRIPDAAYVAETHQALGSGESLDSHFSAHKFEGREGCAAC